VKSRILGNIKKNIEEKDKGDVIDE